MSSRLFWPLVGLLCLAAALAGYRLAGAPDNRQPAPGYGTWLPQPRPLGRFRLTDSRNRPFTRADLEGRVSLVYFGYSHCSHECPDTLAMLARVQRSVGLSRLQVLFVTIDPRRDTPAVLARYLRRFNPDFIGLTGTASGLRRLARGLGVALGKVALPGGGYTFEHTVAVFLFDAHAREAAVFMPPFHARRLAAVLRRMEPRLLAPT